MTRSRVLVGKFRHGESEGYTTLHLSPSLIRRFDKQSKESVETGCADEGLICAEGYQCLCNPCTEIKGMYTKWMSKACVAFPGRIISPVSAHC
jgi:hypothetical protein